MESEIKDQDRKVIPRWRDFKTTLVLGELDSRLLGKVMAPPENAIDEQIFDWENNRSLSFATDLVNTGFALGMVEKVQEAADFVLSQDSRVTELQKRIALQAKNSEYTVQLAEPTEIQPTGREIINHSRQQVQKLREQLRHTLRNPIQLVELSREYATLGSLRKAVRTMDMAIALAPANRFVLRSATRLYVHAEEIERAHFILRRAPSLRSDPWLLAAEISVSSLRGLTSRNITNGKKQIVDANYSPFELSELTSALATLEMENANSRNARKLFRQALRRPTENSIAQAEWASHTITSLDIDIGQFDVPRNYEALASDFYQKGDMSSAVIEGAKWIVDQPFAISPILHTGMSASLIEDFEFGETVYRFGICANPDSVSLRNNLAYILATNNQPEKAEIELSKIDYSLVKDEDRILTTATEGLIRFRQHRYEEGRQLYKQAIKIAQSINQKGAAMRALLYLAREEVLAGTAQGLQAMEIAETEAKRFTPTQETKFVFGKLRAMLGVELEPVRIIRGNLKDTSKLLK